MPRLTKSERHQELGILARLEDKTLSEQKRGMLRHDLQRLRESAKARRHAKYVKSLEPRRDDYETEKDWEVAVELRRLDVMEKAAEKKFDSRLTSFSGLQNAERELRRISKRRKELLSQSEIASIGYELSELSKSMRTTKKTLNAPPKDPTPTVEQLFNSRSIAVCFHGEHSTEAKEVEYALENRQVDWRFWCLPVTKSSGSLIHLYPNRKAAEKLRAEILRNEPDPATIDSF